MSGAESIYGIPRGGSYVALELSNIMGLPLVDSPEQNTLIVDDICDSGETLSAFEDWKTGVLHLKPTAKIRPTFYVDQTKNWIVYPWESKTEGIKDNITRILEFIGEDPNRDGLRDTPTRVEQAYTNTLFAGYRQSPEKILETTFDSTFDQMVVLRDIEFYSFCEHHILPFFGKVSVGYIPNGRVVGISKIARLVEIYSRRLQIQEQLTEQIANTLNSVLKPKGVGVRITARHFCMIARGVNKQQSELVTDKLLGRIKSDDKARSEYLNLI